jgi:hypothetical protein
MKLTACILWYVFWIFVGASLGDWTAKKMIARAYPPTQSPPTQNPAIPDLKLAAEALEDLKRVSADHDVLTFEGLPLADKTVTFLEGWPDAEHPIPDRIEDWRFVVQWHDGKVWVAKWEVKP